MSNKRPIHYEQHPVSRERKAALIAQGYRIVDAKFAPPGAAAETAPPADDAFVEVGATRFSDGHPQTDEGLAAAREALAETPKPRGKPGRKPKAGR